MKFYIASSFQNKDNVQSLEHILSTNGHLSTYDWTMNGRAQTVEQLVRIGTLEKQAIADCDFLFYIYQAGWVAMLS